MTNTEMMIYADRRAKVLKALGKSVAVLKGSPLQTRSFDSEYAYRPDSDLYYLTGYAEMGSAMILDPNNGDKPFTLFVLPSDPAKETWTGRRLGVAGSKDPFGADEVYAIDEFEAVVVDRIKQADRVYTNLTHDVEHANKMMALLHQAQGLVARTGEGPKGIESIGVFTHEMRLIKDAHEIELLRKANKISNEAHLKVMAAIQPGMLEYQLQGILEGYCIQQGATAMAYTSIVGTGDNATVLHYVANRKQIKDGDLVLIDAACEYGYYASDITRTYPANGKFTSPQKALYEEVLNCQNAIIERCKPGVTVQSLHQQAVEILVDGMVKIGLLTGKPEDLIESGEYQKYYMHRTGHWMGMDVHDRGDYRKNGEDRILEPGMVFTVEPGLYIPLNSDAPEKFRGIGIRIEDDILITRDGYENLTHTPKSVEDIERLCSKS
ncbi:MAG: Xaa-Pro aminopeptidase [Candidatus Marinimicrobia bacterium CG_4_9_14_3_um_filter_48_9]|nr:MAG: Xaa-Pro aminopeptidase [Candidatus Marinimicrobia bacterium CG_4_9_14_3_um_filter_48_9]